MKAITLDQYGGPEVLRYAETEAPEPGKGEVLVRVQYSSINAGDWHMIRGVPFAVKLMYGLRKPSFKVPGNDVAGIVEQVGEGVDEFKTGDRVMGEMGGAFAELTVGKADKIALIPKGLSFENAACLPVAGFTALQGLRDHGRLEEGHEVLINGASGGVGAFAVTIARALGAKVTAVCSADKAGMVKELGADEVIDYRKTDFTQNGKLYDLILDCALFRPITENRNSLKENGNYVMVGGGKFFGPMFAGSVSNLFHSRKFRFFVAEPNAADLKILGDLAAEGRIKVPLQKTYKLSEVPDAIRFMEDRKVAGKLAVCAAD